jgi:hypothetical protein
MANIPPRTPRFPGATPRNPPPTGNGRGVGPKPPTPMPKMPGKTPLALPPSAKPAPKAAGMQAFKDGGSVKSMKGFGNSAGGAKSYGKKGKC